MNRRLKKVASIIVAVMMLMPAVPMNGIVSDNLFSKSVSAADLAPTGQCGDNVYWTFDRETGLLTISGEGDMYDYQSGVSPFYDNAYIQNVIIEDGVTSVGINAFSECDLKRITIPGSVLTIGEMAFHYCTRLTEVTLSNGIEEINHSAFWRCSGLKSINFPDSLLTIDTYAFNATGLTSISIPKSVTELGNSPFGQCNGIVEIKVSPENKVYDSRNDCNAIIKTATNELVRGCKNTIIPDNVTRIEDYAFNSSVSLESITIPESVTQIGSSVFDGCTNLTNIIIPDSVASINHNTFMNCKKLTSVTLPKSLQSISNNLFDGCNSLKDIVLPDTVKSIGEMAFRNCTALTSVNLPDSLTTIGMDAFRYCSGLTSIEIPSNCYSISVDAFMQCTGILSITVDENNIYFDSRNSCNAIIRTSSNTLIMGCKNTVIPGDVSKIGDYSFSYLTDLTSITIPESVTNIGNSAFNGCTKMSDVYYSGSESQWNSITFGTKNENLLNAIIHYNYGKTSGTCGDGVSWTFNKSNGNLLIYGSGAMDSNAAFEDYSWYSFKDEIRYVKVGDGITKVGANAFSGCPDLKEVYLGSDVTELGSNAFANCSSLGLATFTSSSVKDDSAFSGNKSNLTFVIAEGNADAIKLASDKRAATVLFEYKNKTIDFKNKIVIYGELDYNYLSELVNKYISADELHFSSLEFYGYSSDVISIDNCENIISSANNFTLNDMYVRIKVLKDGENREVSFEQMFELLENGKYDAFKLVIKTPDVPGGEKEETIFQKIVSFFEDLGTNALRVITKAINFVVKIFKR